MDRIRFHKGWFLSEFTFKCIRAIGFQDKNILKLVSDHLCEFGGSYHLTNRNPIELDNIEETWFQLVNQLSRTHPPIWERESIRNLGKRIKLSAEYISKQLSPSYDDDFATIVHGDYKSMNIFLPLDGNQDPIMIDFASVGVGNAMSDVAMHITHALHPNDLINGGEEYLVNAYLDALEDSLPDTCSYPRDVSMRHYKLAKLDYFRFVLGRLWKGVTIEKIENSAENKNSVFVNRNIDAAIYFVEEVDAILAEFEDERKDWFTTSK